MTSNYFWKAFDLDPVPEYRFAPPRKWRFDYAFPEYRIAVEIDGGIWTRGRHTRGLGYLKDMEKFNEAGKLGWRVFRFTPQQFGKGIAQSFVAEVIRDCQRNSVA